MAKGGWSFLQEWAIYEYLMARYEEGSLRIRPVRVSGKSAGRERWVKVALIRTVLADGPFAPLDDLQSFLKHWSSPIPFHETPKGELEERSLAHCNNSLIENLQDNLTRAWFI